MLLQVTTMRSMSNQKVTWPCLTDSVTKLEGCGAMLYRNLADIRKYAAKLGLHAVVPRDCPNKVGTGECNYSTQPLCCCYHHCICMHEQVAPPHYTVKVRLFLMLRANMSHG